MDTAETPELPVLLPNGAACSSVERLVAGVLSRAWLQVP